MARQLIVAIAESAESLEQQLKHSRTASQKERLQMLWWLKTGQITQHQTLAKRLGRDGSTVTRWLQKYRQGGLSELLALKSAPGKSPHLSLEVIAGLQKRLEQPPGFKSYGEIVEWLNETYQLNLTYPTVYHWVHYRLKAKLKVPRPKSAKQEPSAAQRFKKTSPQPC
ncbi:helix-turn-helix domain-containing protein [Microcoleus sp. MON1_C1]|uniref:helix-turn-helix domain-containing protein n=1 Tax=Microcoleus sp. MON1_C1 TaxID=2818827 RepID=UPI002FD4576E